MPIDASVTIGPLIDPDLRAVGELFTGHTGRPADLEAMARWMADAPAAAARRGGMLIGYLIGKRFAPDVVELASLLVHPDHRGHGVAGALISEVEQLSVAQGYAGAVVVTSSGYQTLKPKAATAGLFERHRYRPVLSTAITTVLGRNLTGQP